MKTGGQVSDPGARIAVARIAVARIAVARIAVARRGNLGLVTSDGNQKCPTLCSVV